MSDLDDRLANAAPGDDVEMTWAEAEALGAFEEPALSEADARASVDTPEDSIDGED